MNCREARADIALFAGGDLDDRAQVRELRQHVHGCPECRAHYDAVKASLKSLAALAPLDAAATWESGGSLWPSIRRELAKPPQALTAAQAVNQLKNWTPFAAMTAACVLMLVALGHFGAQPEQPVSSRGLTTHPPLALQPAEEHEEPKPLKHTEEHPNSPGRSQNF